MAPSSKQLVFDLPLRSALGAEDFMVSGSNAQAVELVDRWPNWPHWAAVVIGPQGSGKTHLANVWRNRSRAEACAARDLTEDLVTGFPDNTALVVEDLDRGIADERLLFHLLNLAREHRRSIFCTSRIEPGQLSIALPDLRSRARALPIVNIAPPDDELLRGVLVKLFADRQLAVSPQVIGYISLRMERSMRAAGAIVEGVDHLALTRHSKVTKPLVKEVLDTMAEN